MKTKSLLVAAFLVLLSAANAQNLKNSNSSYPIDEIASYQEDGMKMSVKNNTPLIISGISDNATGANATEMALDWIARNKELLKIDNLDNLVVSAQHEGPSGNTVRFQQKVNGVSVYKSEIVVHISPRNKVTYVTNTFDASAQNMNTTASLSPAQAMSLAKNEINLSGNAHFESNELTLFTRGDENVLVYKIVLEADHPNGSWEVMVNAENGNIIRAVDQACNHNEHGDHEQNDSGSFLPPMPPPVPVDGIGNVFNPDPLSVVQAPYAAPYNDNNDATNASMDATMSSVTLLDINFTGTEYELIGPYAEITDFESPFNGLFSQATSDFSFTRDNDAFEAVNCYYHIDQNLRYINETLTIPCMPFQYSGGAQFDPSGLNGADNSHYLGGSGRVSFGEGGVDDAEDADVVLHELGHGIHDWLTNGNLSQVDGLSEGCGDYWAMSYSRSLNQWTTADPAYHWMFSWDGHNQFWNGRITNYGALYPGGLTGSIHTNGQIWATVLMRIYDQIGRTNVDAAFLEGLAMTGNNTSQEDAAIAVRQAAIDMGYSCADVDVFTTEFTATGYNMPPIPGLSSTVSDNICPGETVVINGTVYDENNLTGTEIITTSNGCDSTVTVNLILTSIDLTLTNTDPVISSNQSGASYQWIDCDNGNTPIAAATNQSYTATSNGNYAVEITVGSCIETSPCQFVNTVGLDELDSESISVYPNPSNGIFTVAISESSASYNYKITAVDGRIVREVNGVTGSTFLIDLSQETSGIYFLNINDSSEVIQLILESK